MVYFGNGEFQLDLRGFQDSAIRRSQYTIVCESISGPKSIGLNVVIYSQYRQNFRACGELKTRALCARGNLITPLYRAPPSLPKRLSTTRGPTPQPQARSRPLPAADSEEAAPSEPDPASTRSQSASPRLLESGRRNTGTGKKTPGGAGTHTSQTQEPYTPVKKTPGEGRRTRDTRAVGRNTSTRSRSHRRTSVTRNPPTPPHYTRTDRTTAFDRAKTGIRGS